MLGSVVNLPVACKDYRTRKAVMGKERLLTFSRRFYVVQSAEGAVRAVQHNKARSPLMQGSRIHHNVFFVINQLTIGNCLTSCERARGFASKGASKRHAQNTSKKL